MNISDLLKKLQILSQSGWFDGIDFEEIHILKKPAYDNPGIRIFGYDKDGNFKDEAHFFPELKIVK